MFKLLKTIEIGKSPNNGYAEMLPKRRTSHIQPLPTRNKKHLKLIDIVPFVAIGYFYCYDVAEYNKVIAQNRDAIINDIKKYTNIQPVIQISEIKQLRYNNIK